MIALSVVSCCNILASKGVCEGDEMSFAAELSLDDSYCVIPGTEMSSVILRPEGAIYRISPVSPVGRSDAELRVDAQVTLASPDGALLRGILLVEIQDGLVQAVYLHPQGQLSSGLDYRLIEISPAPSLLPSDAPAATALGADTLIACAEGLRRADELVAGDLVMTQTDGLRPLQDVSHSVVEATGDTAPLLLRRGALGNHASLILGRGRRVRTGRRAALQPLASLVDGRTILPAQGGHLPMVTLTLPGAPVILAGGLATDAGGVATVVNALPARATHDPLSTIRLTGTISG